MKLVLDMRDRRSIWALPAWVPERIRAALPPGWSLAVMDEPADGSADGSARVPPTVLAAVADAGAYLGFGLPGPLLAAAPKLRWAHSGSAGVASALTPELFARPELIFTNSAGIHAVPMAESVLGMILHFTRGLDLAAAGQARGAWVQETFYGADVPVLELSTATVGIVGFGGIGYEVGRRVAALGARVIGAVRRPRARPVEPLVAVGSDAVVGQAEVVHGDAGLDRLLRESDVVVLAAPDTQGTRGLIGTERIARMKPSAILINVGRGRLVDDTALVEALGTGRLRGAALDVFATEPLPADHPFWTTPNLLVTPHVTAVTRGFWEREADLILHNLAALANGTAMRNVVDRGAGY